MEVMEDILVVVVPVAANYRLPGLKEICGML